MPEIRLPALDSYSRPTCRRTPRRGLLYSPRQAACGVFIGGPVALIYFLKSNFSVLGNVHAERKLVIAGSFLILAVIASILIFPRAPASSYGLIYVLIARHVVEKHQMGKEAIADSYEYDFHSNWNVLALGILCLFGSAATIIGPLLALVYLGIHGHR